MSEVDRGMSEDTGRISKWGYINLYAKAMKSLKFCWVLSLVIAFCFIVGCDKATDDPNPPIPQVIVPFDGTITYNPPDSIEKNGNVSISCNTNAESGKVVLNDNVTFSFDGGVWSRTMTLFESTNFVFTLIKNDSSFIMEHTISVYEIENPPSFSIIVFAEPDSVFCGDSTLITIIKLGVGELNYITVNPNITSFTGQPGSFWTPALSETITYHFTGYGEGGTCSVSATINVIILSLRTQILCANPWVPDSIWYRYSEEDQWTYFPPNQCAMYLNVYVFYPDGFKEVYLLPDYILVSTPDNSWYFIEGEEYIYWPYEEKHIEKLVPGVFIYDFIIDNLFLRKKDIPYYQK